MKPDSTLRCQITGNPYGTDTRPEGQPCLCGSCLAGEQMERLQAELAEAQAREGQFKEQIARMAMGEAGMRDDQIDAAIARSKREALATPVPEPTDD